MWCIFCQENKQPSEEHIIPENIGGSVITYQVCKSCNSTLGSYADSELNKHRHIYDAYQKLQTKGKPELQFRFHKSTFIRSDGTKINVSNKSDSAKIQVTRLSENEFTIAPNDNKFILKYMKKKGKQKGISEKYVTNQITDYLEWSKSKQVSDSYEDEALELQVNFCSSVSSRKTIMSGKTPLRFLTKACVEFVYLLGLQDNITNLNILRKHALHGTDLSLIRSNEEPIWEKAIPFHIIAFHNNQFQIHFFAQYGFSIEIELKKSMPNISLANDITNKSLHVCKSEDDGIRITNQILEFKWDHLL